MAETGIGLRVGTHSLRVLLGEPDVHVLVRAEGLTKHFPLSSNPFARSHRVVHAVDGVSFVIPEGESLGLVGESGSGKTTTAKLVAKLLEPTSGSLLFSADGQQIDVATLRGRPLKQFRRHVQMIFQDPYESMNPRMTIFDAVAEPLVVQQIGSIRERSENVSSMLALVGLSPPSTYLFRYPHELSGGQRQRVAIARALILRPALVVADEPTSMLDVSTRTDLIRLMLDLAANLHVSYLYITHDLAVARYMCTRIAVMYLGKIVEVAETEQLLTNPLHPYTRALIAAVPRAGPNSRGEEVKLIGGIPNPVNPPPRCRFLDRCPISAEVCRLYDHPPLTDVGDDHWVACYRV